MDVTCLYNEKIKLQYLESIAHEDTKENVLYIFKKTKSSEEIYEKDILEMNMVELSDIMWGLEASSTDSSYNNAHKLQQYIDWAIIHGYRKTNIHPFSVIEDKRQWAKQFVIIYKNSLFSRKEILEMCDVLVNYSDKALLLSLFEGIVGTDYSEITNLKIGDISEENGVFFARLVDKKRGKRKIRISEKLYDYLFLTDSAALYYNKNGLSDSRNSSTSQFIESPYVFKKMVRGNAKNEDELDGSYVRRKIALFKEVFSLDYLTAKEITTSGILAMVYESFQKNESESEELWMDIAEHYNTPYTSSNGNMRRNTLNLKRKTQESAFINKYMKQEVKNEQKFKR